jgi:hypothetical protein
MDDNPFATMSMTRFEGMWVVTIVLEPMLDVDPSYIILRVLNNGRAALTLIDGSTGQDVELVDFNAAELLHMADLLHRAAGDPGDFESRLSFQLDEIGASEILLRVTHREASLSGITESEGAASVTFHPAALPVVERGVRTVVSLMTPPEPG